MYNPTDLSVSNSPKGKWLKLALFTVVAIIGATRLWEGLEIHRTPSIIMGAAIIILSIFGCFQILRYRIILGESQVEQQSLFGSQQLLYTAVLQVKERKRILHLIGPTVTVRIRPDTDRFDEVAAKIASKLNALPVLRTEGNLSRWGIADRDDEGRLVRR